MCSRAILVGILLQTVPLACPILNNFTCEFALDRAEYEHLAQIARVYEGKPIYVPMTFEYVPITYTPLYWQVSGWLWKLTGPGFPAPRLVCLSSMVVYVWFVGRFLRAVTGGDVLLTAAGIMQVVFVSLFTGGWAFIISNNALHFAFIVAGFSSLRETTRWSLERAAVCLSLGVLAKQTGLAYLVVGGVFVALKEPQKMLAVLLPALIVCGGGLAYLHVGSHGKFYGIIVTENLGPSWELTRHVDEVRAGQFLALEAILLSLSLWPLVRDWTFRGAWTRLLSPEYVMAGSGLVGASIAQPKSGSTNLHAVMAITGLVICGWQGLSLIVQDFRRAKFDVRLRNVAVLLQTAVLFMPAWQSGSLYFIDGTDRERYTEIANVFKRGYTVHYHVPCITSSFGCPEAGHQGTELCRWIDGRWSHANKPDFLASHTRSKGSTT